MNKKIPYIISPMKLTNIGLEKIITRLEENIMARGNKNVIVIQIYYQGYFDALLFVSSITDEQHKESIERLNNTVQKRLEELHEDSL